ncbi:outer membrane beta-barrel domain protein [Neorickettsia helminthoeca str. Oregon]|uniref:Outer membrane beta-barrel domain protein n=1 Tax=Neorickettsia helminthoeca str. Oregon TaxID=1286528 RepID=X5H588_9RICK|nr:hypothetical protein [Neorickettsia helminthoeca]AHX11751.1 outer membrane beta-barrel domain protein [Neorickettsia helminthoeca str. Oregon]
MLGCRIAILLSLLLFLSPAEALFGINANTGFYISGGYGALMSGKAGVDNAATYANQAAQKFRSVSKDHLLHEDLKNFNVAAGFSILGFSLDVEGLYGYLESAKTSKNGTLKLKLPEKVGDQEFSYFLGFVNANLEFSGAALLNPYVGLGIGTGTVTFAIENKDSDRRYGFPLATQIKAGLALDLGSYFFVSLKPYIGYRMLMVSSTGVDTLSVVPTLIPTQNANPDAGIAGRIKEVVTAISDISHTSHNAEIGIKIQLGI